MFNRSTYLGVLLAATFQAPTGATAQQFQMTGSAAKVIVLGDGRMAIITTGPNGATVEGVVDADKPGGPAVDLQIGDLITRFQDLKSPTADQIGATFDGLKAGTTITIGIRRGGSGRVVVFERPAVASGTRMAVSGSKGAGAWTTGEGPSDVQEMVIAGAHIRNNDQGLPVVTHRRSHPAALSVNLRAGDQILTINGLSLAALAGLELGYSRIPIGGEVVLTVAREAKTVTVQFTKPTDR